MSSVSFGTDRISLGGVALKPHEWPFKLQNELSGPLRLGA